MSIVFFPSRTVAVALFGFAVHWYGLLYLAAFLLAWFLLPRLQSLRNVHLSSVEWERLLSWCVVGVVLGGRLGFVLFYEPAYFIAHPAHIIAVWEGGMSSHGGFLGVSIALLIALRGRWQDLLRLADVIVVPVALGLALGRIGNLINGELYGTVTSVPWAMAVPGVEGLRHPTAVYAIAKDLTIALLCGIHLRFARPVHPGSTAALFLLLYGLLRSIVEVFRDQPYGWVDLGIVSVTRGQLLTIPIFVMGVGLWVWTTRRKNG